MVESIVESDTGISARVKREFEKWISFYEGIGEEPDKAAEHALNQTLYPTGLDRAQVRREELNREASRQIAQDLINKAPSRMAHLVGQFTKGNYGDPVEQLNFSDRRAQRIFALAKGILKQKG